jgi:2-epi-5-epi-valiolone synthase
MLEIVENQFKELNAFKMKTIISSEIDIEWGDLFAQLSCKSSKTIVFIDPIVHSLHVAKFNEIEKLNDRVQIVPTKVNETTKDLDSLIRVLERFENLSVGRRDDFIYAVGGGALLDLVSLAANLYRRGVPVVKVPTTLLGCVDASIGIKTGLNFLNRRNRLGSYYLNYSVLLDTQFLTSLDSNLIREGLGEIFKIALIKSSKLFELLEASKFELLNGEFYNRVAGQNIIGLSIQLMLEELHDNPTETNLKRCVDFGHSFSPLVEMYSIEKDGVESIPHGIAVGNDCVITSIISNHRGSLSNADLSRIIRLADYINFRKNHYLHQSVEVMWGSFADMTKHRGGDQNLPIPTAIGTFDFIQDLNYSELEKAVLENIGE